MSYDFWKPVREKLSKQPNAKQTRNIRESEVVSNPVSYPKHAGQDYYTERWRAQASFVRVRNPNSIPPRDGL